ncbi:MAG: (Fe-S)-binding protein [Candidatus Magnetomorum sp.]|nr:(Fe-S)-binding protein [Candidatus Magnetomorum sp.]
MTKELTILSKNYSGTCIRCGACMSVCPVYQVSLEETDVARGKMALIEWSQSHPEFSQSSRFRQLISRCLLCGACAQSCPNQVATHACIQQMRQGLSKSHKEKIMLSSLKTLSKKSSSSQFFRTSGSIFQRLMSKKLPETSGMHLRFPIASISHRQFLPKISVKSFTEAYSIQHQEQPSKRIVYFTGCGANYFFVETAAALVKLLERKNIHPFVPKDQVCCGLPFFASGDQTNAIALARQNIDIIDQLSPDIVLTTCASCGAHIHQWADLFKDDPEYHCRAQKIARCQKDAMMFLLESFDRNDLIALKKSCEGPPKENVWYHHPCHQRFGKTQLPLPKKLFTPFSHANIHYSDSQCCGNGGKFQLSHFDLSMKIFDQRMEAFSNQKITHVLTPCTGCQLQFAEGMLRYDMDVTVEHPLCWLF